MCWQKGKFFGAALRAGVSENSRRVWLSFSKDVFNHHKCRSTASSLSMPLLPISVHKGIAIASHFARGLCTPQPQCWWKEGFPCPNVRLCTVMVSGGAREAAVSSMEVHSGNVQRRERVL